MADYKKSSVHCHSTMCDGKNTLQDMASAACAQGLTTLGFTGHSYTQRDREYCMSPSRTAQYKATIAKLKAEYRGKVDILCGIEWDILSEDKRTGYDYWIGSAHHLYGKNTGKYYEIDFRPQDLHDCIFDDFGGDALGPRLLHEVLVGAGEAGEPVEHGHLLAGEGLGRQVDGEAHLAALHCGAVAVLLVPATEAFVAADNVQIHRRTPLPRPFIDGRGCDGISSG